MGGRVSETIRVTQSASPDRAGRVLLPLTRTEYRNRVFQVYWHVSHIPGYCLCVMMVRTPWQVTDSAWR